MCSPITQIRVGIPRAPAYHAAKSAAHEGKGPGVVRSRVPSAGKRCGRSKRKGHPEPANAERRHASDPVLPIGAGALVWHIDVQRSGAEERKRHLHPTAYVIPARLGQIHIDVETPWAIQTSALSPSLTRQCPCVETIGTPPIVPPHATAAAACVKPHIKGADDGETSHSTTGHWPQLPGGSPTIEHHLGTRALDRIKSTASIAWLTLRRRWFVNVPWLLGIDVVLM